MRDSKLAYSTQKHDAARRGIGWEFTYPQWLAWWGDDLSRRGVGPLDLQMQRIADSGPYHPDNVRKGTPKDNAATRGRMQRHKESRAARQAILAAEMEKPAIVVDWEDPPDLDNQYHSNRFGDMSKYKVYGV